MTEISANISLNDRVFNIIQSVQLMRFVVEKDVTDMALGSRGKEYL